MSDTIYQCSSCGTQTKGFSDLCNPCSVKKSYTPELREKRRKKMMGNTISTGRPKGAKNKNKYVRDINTYSRCKRPYNRDPEKIQAQKDTWEKKSDEEISQIMKKQQDTKKERMKTYKGRYTPKNKEKYRGDANNIVYRSQWEKYCMMHFDSQSTVKSWSSEEIVIPYYYDVDGRYHRYFTDFFVEYTNGKKVLIEVKPFNQTHPPKKPKRKTKKYINEGYTYVKNKCKWTAAERYCEERDWTFLIWTEKELTRMGILPKSTKKLKPFTRKPKKKI